MSRALGAYIGKKMAEKREKERLEKVEAFRKNPEKWRQFVYRTLTKHKIVPSIKEFINKDYKKRKNILKAWGKLWFPLKRGLTALTDYDPHDTGFLVGYILARAHKDEKNARKAFTKSKEEPTDKYGNPKTLGTMFLSLYSVLKSCYKGLTLEEHGDSAFTTRQEVLNEQMKNGAIRQFEDLQHLNSVIEVVEQQMTNFSQ